MFADFFDRKRLLPVSRKYRQKTTRYHIFCSVGHLIQSGYMQKCFAAHKLFLSFNPHPSGTTATSFLTAVGPIQHAKEGTLAEKRQFW
jgi:hypothetical protein